MVQTQEENNWIGPPYHAYPEDILAMTPRFHQLNFGNPTGTYVR